MALLGALALAPGGCGSSAGGRPQGPQARTSIPARLSREARPIGRGARFHPPAQGPVIGPCRRRLGSRVGVHVELFADDRVILVAAGVGTRPPRRTVEGRITAARCYGSLVTLEPTGVILLRPGSRMTVAGLMRSWGQPLGARRLASFQAEPGRTVTAFVDGHRRRGSAGRIPLTRHAEIVLEVGPWVPPHSVYRFPPGV